MRPRSTVYVGPRLIVSRSGETATRVRQLQEVAESLGWVATVHDDDEASVTDEQDDARLGVVRLDLTVRDERATIAPDGWVLLQNARATHGIEAMSRVGLDHIVLVRSIDPNPFHGSNPFHSTHPFHRNPAARLRRRPPCPPTP